MVFFSKEKVFNLCLVGAMIVNYGHFQFFFLLLCGSGHGKCKWRQTKANDIEELSYIQYFVINFSYEC